MAKIEVDWFRLFYLALLFIVSMIAIPVQGFILSFTPVRSFELYNIISFFMAYLVAFCLTVIVGLILVLVGLFLSEGKFYFFKIVKEKKRRIKP